MLYHQIILIYLRTDFTYTMCVTIHTWDNSSGATDAYHRRGW